MSSKIVKSTSKGQITLPMAWRKRFKTSNYILEISEEKIMIKPFKINYVNEEIIFDADRDNDGKAIPVSSMIKMLKKLKNG